MRETAGLAVTFLSAVCDRLMLGSLMPPWMVVCFIM